MAVKRIWTCAALVAASVAMLVTAGTAAADMAFSQFDTCLQKNGLSAAPADQSASTVQVCKTVKVTKVTNYTWTLTKAATPPTLLLNVGQGAPVTYNLVATATPSVSWVVDGDIVVRNTGPEMATVNRIDDHLALPNGTGVDKTVASSAFVLPANLCDNPPERSFHYTFTVPAESVSSAAATSSNNATVNATVGAAAPASLTFTAPVSFAEGPDTNYAVYNRTVTLTDAFDAPPTGVAVGPIDKPGPFVLTGDSPSPMTTTFTSRATNVSLRCDDPATVADTATLTSASALPEKTGRPSTPTPVPSPANAVARVSVLVRSPACGTSGGPQVSTPNVTPAGVPSPQSTGGPSTQPPGPGLQPTGPRVTPAGIPVKKPPAKPPVTPAGACPRPLLEASLIGPRSMLVGERPTWLLRVRNTGSALARRLTLVEKLPPGFSVAAASQRFSFRSGLMRFAGPTLKRGQVFDVRVTLQAARGTSGPRMNRIRATAMCGATETAVSPVTVSAVTG